MELKLTYLSPILSVPASSNRTFMELKPEKPYRQGHICWRSNRTFMELKHL